MNKRVMLGMSGGVDSSVAAYLLKQKGYEVTGMTMRLCLENTTDIGDAKRVAEALEIPHSSADFSEKFEQTVISDFVSCYKSGGTPNPCVVCNKHIKFGEMLEYALSQGIDYIATGHYARIELGENNRRLLLKAKDETKDQTYFLYTLTQHQLAHTLFPLGEYSKSEIREIASEQTLVNAKKRDSQDICFVSDGDYASFIQNYTGECFSKGNFVDLCGNVLGEHNGIIKYTVGQRKGLGIALGKPAFVHSKDVVSNTVTLSDDAELYSKKLTASRINLSAVDTLCEPTRLYAKIRYRHTPAIATVIQTSPTTLSLEFDEPQRAISKGQSVVLYDGDVVVGGGIID